MQGDQFQASLDNHHHFHNLLSFIQYQGPVTCDNMMLNYRSGAGDGTHFYPQHSITATESSSHDSTQLMQLNNSTTQQLNSTTQQLNNTCSSTQLKGFIQLTQIMQIDTTQYKSTQLNTAQYNSLFCMAIKY